jgi:hypothetical protein
MNEWMNECVQIKLRMISVNILETWQLQNRGITMAWYDVVMGTFLKANRGFYEHYRHTYLQPINPLQSNLPSGPPKMHPQSINPHLHTSASSFHSQNPSLSCSWITCLSSFNQYNTSLLSQSYPKACVSSTTTSSEDDINIQVLLEQFAFFLNKSVSVEVVFK